MKIPTDNYNAVIGVRALGFDQTHRVNDIPHALQGRLPVVTFQVDQPLCPQQVRTVNIEEVTNPFLNCICA